MNKLVCSSHIVLFTCTISLLSCTLSEREITKPGEPQVIDIFGAGAVANKNRSEPTLTPQEKLLEATVKIKTFTSGQPYSQGSGVFIADNEIATNHHVIDLATEFEIYNSKDQIIGRAVVSKIDRKNDLAILRISNHSAKEFFNLDDVSMQVGDLIWVAGAPIGLTGTLSDGIISAIHNSTENFGVPLIQITAPISPGSSGGPVMNKNGKLIGITVGSMEEGQQLNFAVPIEKLKELSIQY